MQKDYSIGSIDYSSGNQFDFSQQIEEKMCHFCTGINLNRCMTISVFNKHNEQANFYSKLVNKLVQNDHSPLFIKYEELLKKIDVQEKLTKYYPKSRYNLQIKQLLEYYKFRKFVPLFGDLRLGKILNSYYYLRLKLYYNQIKKKLNLTIDPSSVSHFTQQQSISVSRPFVKSKLLNDLTNDWQVNVNDNQSPNLQNYKTQSKALQDLVNLLKSNQKFKFVRPLNVESQWQKQKITSKQMFKDTILQINKQKQKGFNKGKSKIFITFYSRDTPLDPSKKNSLRILSSQKLAKSKDLKKTIKQGNKQKEYKLLQKLGKLKDDILDVKFSPLINKSSSKKMKQTSSNYSSAVKSNVFKDQQSRNFLKIKQKQKQIHSGKKTPLKINPNEKKTKDFIKKLGNQKLILGNTATTQIKNTPYKQESQKLLGIRQKRSKSEAKILKKTPIPQRSKSIKALTNKQIQPIIKGKKLFISNDQQNTHEKQQNRQESKQSPKRRKSLDLTKMKTNLLQGIENKIQYLKKQDFLTQRYTKLILPEQKPSIQIRTTNVSPVNKKKEKDYLDEIVVQKTDNIMSIRKKKLELLKKRIEIQKSQKK